MSDEQETKIIEDYEALVGFLVKPLLGSDDFKVKTRDRGDTLELQLETPANIRGRVIGRGGRIARSLRTIISSAAIPTHKRVSFDIVD